MFKYGKCFVGGPGWTDLLQAGSTRRSLGHSMEQALKGCISHWFLLSGTGLLCNYVCLVLSCALVVMSTTKGHNRELSQCQCLMLSNCDLPLAFHHSDKKKKKVFLGMTRVMDQEMTAIQRVAHYTHRFPRERIFLRNSER